MKSEMKMMGWNEAFGSYGVAADGTMFLEWKKLPVSASRAADRDGALFFTPTGYLGGVNLYDTAWLHRFYPEWASRIREIETSIHQVRRDSSKSYLGSVVHRSSR